MTSARLSLRLQQLEAVRARMAPPDSPQAQAVAAALAELFARFDPDGSIRARFDAAPDSEARAVAVCDLLDRGDPTASAEFLSLLAVAQGRPPCNPYTKEITNG